MKSLFSQYEDELIEILVQSAVACILKSVDDLVVSVEDEHKNNHFKKDVYAEQESFIEQTSSFKVCSKWLGGFLLYSYETYKQKINNKLNESLRSPKNLSPFEDKKIVQHELANATENNNSVIRDNHNIASNNNKVMEASVSKADACNNTETEEPLCSVLFFPDAGLLATLAGASDGRRRRSTNSFSRDAKTSSPNARRGSVPSTSLGTSPTSASTVPSTSATSASTAPSTSLGTSPTSASTVPSTSPTSASTVPSTSPSTGLGLLGGSTAVRYMCDTLLAAEETIDVCVFVFTYDPLCSALLHAKARGVAVRVLLDHSMACVDGSVAARLRRARVRVRLAGQQGMCHHKFAVVDAEGRRPAVLTGSLNWTRTAVLSNSENVLLCRLRAVARGYAGQFLALWGGAGR